MSSKKQDDDAPASTSAQDEAAPKAESNEPLSRKDLLRSGLDRAMRSGAMLAGYAMEDIAGRVVPKVARPPGALPALEFLLACTRCDACIRACPPGAILRLGEGSGVAAGTPFLNVSEYKPCTACDDVPCARACPTGALVPGPIENAWMGTAVLDRDTCRAWNGTPCSSCVRICPVDDAAIVTDDDGRVYIDARGCIGCGLCAVVCPTRPRSLRVEPPSLA